MLTAWVFSRKKFINFDEVLKSIPDTFDFLVEISRLVNGLKLFNDCFQIHFYQVIVLSLAEIVQSEKIEHFAEHPETFIPFIVLSGKNFCVNLVVHKF